MPHVCDCEYSKHEKLFARSKRSNILIFNYKFSILNSFQTLFELFEPITSVLEFKNC